MTGDTKSIQLIGNDGLRGTIIRHELHHDTPYFLVEIEDGERFLVPEQVMVEQPDGSYYLPLSRNELLAQREIGAEENERIVVPVIAEELSVQKRVVETGVVRISKIVHERKEVVDEPLLRQDVQVERVVVNQMVDTMPSIRHEGETMIVPVLEEVLVVEKRLILKEELHITKRQTSTSQPQQVTLRHEEVVVERITSDE